MKKSMVISSFLALLLMLSACAPNNDNNEDNHNQSNGVNAPKHAKNLTENDIFTSNKSHQKLTEDEMNKAIKKYLDVNSDILDNKYIMQSKIDRQSSGQTKITDKQAKNLVIYLILLLKMTYTLKNMLKITHCQTAIKIM